MAQLGNNGPRRGGRDRAGSGARAAQALELVRTHPGITIGDLAKLMKIQPNYLYRVMPRLASAGQLMRQGRGWRATEPASINGTQFSRLEALADVLGSVRLESVEPSPEMVIALQRWADGAISDDELGDLAAQAAAGKALVPEMSTQLD